MRWLSIAVLLAAAGCTEGGARAGARQERAVAAEQEQTAPASGRGEAIAPESPWRRSPMYGRSQHYEVRLELDPPEPAVDQLFRVIAQIRDRQTGAPVEAKAVRLDATMPDHQHGMLTAPEQRQVGEGTWEAEGFRLHMPGVWRFEVQVGEGAAAEEIHVAWEQPPRWTR